MTPEALTAELNAVIATDVKLGWPRAVGIHVAQVALNGLTGEAALYPDLQPLAKELIATAVKLGGAIEITNTFRTFATQQALYAEGRTTAGAVVTQAQGGESYHNYGLAFDIAITSLPAGDTQESFYAHLGTFFESIGGVWGGDFADDDHFEWHPNFTWHDLISYFQVTV